MNSKAKKELKKYIKSTQERIDKCSLIRDEIYEYGLYKISNIDENDGVNKEIRKQRKILKNLNEIQELSDKLCIGEKIYITDDIYFEINISFQRDSSYMLCGKFYFDSRIVETELYEEYYSSYGKLNKMINDVLSSVLCMTMAEGYGIPTINFKTDIYKYEIEIFENILDILNKPDNWKVELLKDTASNIISKILNNIEEYKV